MKPETEVMFGDIDKDEMRAALTAAGARLVRPEYDQRRTVFDLPSPDVHKWVRIRDEGNRITLSYKEAGTTLEEQQEAELVVDDYDTAVDLVGRIGCTPFSTQETKREEWELDGAQVTLDTWPYLPPLMEIEGETLEAIQAAAEKLGMDYSSGIFGTVNLLYKAKYGRFIEDLPAEKRAFTFDGPNPFED